MKHLSPKTIRIELPNNRDYTGVLRLLAVDGQLIAGPFRVCARSGDELAVEHGNPSRATTLPYGDTPLGTYRLLGIVATGLGTKYRADLYGAHGALVLRPIGGDAALAEANGRFEILIHGGALSPDGRLRATSGGLRLADDHLRELARHLGEEAGLLCECVEAATTFDSVQVEGGASFHEASNPSRSHGWVTPPRRRILTRELIAHGEYAPEDDQTAGSVPVPELVQPPAGSDAGSPSQTSEANSSSDPTIDPFTGDTSGASLGLDPFTGGQTVDPFIGAPETDPYTGGACTNPFTGSGSSDPYTSGLNDSGDDATPSGDGRSQLAAFIEGLLGSESSVNQGSGFNDGLSYVSTSSYAPEEKQALDDDTKPLPVPSSWQGAIDYYGVSAINDASVRADYRDAVADLGDDVGYSPERTELKILAREESSPLAREIADYISPIEDDVSKMGRAGATNEGVNLGMDYIGAAGWGLIGVSAAVSAYDIYAAPEGTTGLVAAEELGSFAGGLAFGSAGAEVGAAWGADVGAVLGEVIFPLGGGVPGAAAGGIIGAALGGFFGSMAGSDTGTDAGKGAYIIGNMLLP